MRAVHLNELVGDALYQGFTYGGTLYFESSDTFSKADYPGLRAVKVKVQAGGGGGGGCIVSSSGHASAGGGGAGGGYCESFILVDDLAADETVTVGAGGSGGAAGNNDGSVGGDSSFGPLLDAPGGLGGNGMPSNAAWTWAYEGGAPNVTSGDIRIEGRSGERGIVVDRDAGTCRVVQPAGGGDSHLGKGGSDFTNSTTASNGQIGRGYGGGGSGAYRNQNTGQQPGGDGADGIVIVELYF